MKGLLAWSWLLLLVLPLVEAGSHLAARAAVPARSDYAQAADFVRTQLAPKDLITSAPSWTDPRLREVLGDHIDLAMAGRSDTSAYERLWSLSLRGARPPEAPAGKPPELSKRFGAITVERWSLGPSTVLVDVTRELARAEVRYAGDACPWQRFELPRGGGLGTGILPPRERFACSGPRGSWVAPVVMEDLSLAPRHCVAHPALRKPITVTLRDIPLGERIAIYAGVYYEHERMRQGQPITLRARVNGQELGQLEHHDGDGWSRITLRSPTARGDLSIEVQGNDKKPRHFCWAASSRAGAER